MNGPKCRRGECHKKRLLQKAPPGFFPAVSLHCEEKSGGAEGSFFLTAVMLDGAKHCVQPGRSPKLE